MTYGGRGRRRSDDNQKEIVKFLRGCGASVSIISSLPGELDLIVGYAGVDQRVEVKDGSKCKLKRRLTEDEEMLFCMWRGRPPVVIESTDDCEIMLREMARAT